MIHNQNQKAEFGYFPFTELWLREGNSAIFRRDFSESPVNVEIGKYERDGHFNVSDMLIEDSFLLVLDELENYIISSPGQYPIKYPKIEEIEFPADKNDPSGDRINARLIEKLLENQNVIKLTREEGRYVFYLFDKKDDFKLRLGARNSINDLITYFERSRYVTKRCKDLGIILGQ